jgi:hypothetical protein
LACAYEHIQFQQPPFLYEKGMLPVFNVVALVFTVAGGWNSELAMNQQSQIRDDTDVPGHGIIVHFNKFFW